MNAWAVGGGAGGVRKDNAKANQGWVRWRGAPKRVRRLHPGLVSLRPHGERGDATARIGDARTFLLGMPAVLAAVDAISRA